MSRHNSDGGVMNLHRAIQTESRAGYYSPMRHCQGACRQRRSITQFAAGSDVCMRCVNRSS
jgi:hypothetical protein